MTGFQGTLPCILLVLLSLAPLPERVVALRRIYTDLNESSSQVQPDAQILDVGVEERLSSLRSRGIAWLKSRRTEEFGWEAGDTPRVVLALASALEDWPSPNDLEAKLTVKQLEIELLDKLLRHSVDPISPARVAIFALALNAACRDPRDFYGHNLIASLERHSAVQDFPRYPEGFGFSLTALVGCLSDSILHKKTLRRLITIANEEASVDSIDTRSMAIMALECYRRKRPSETLTKHMADALRKVTRLQRSDGSFGNIHTTTMAIQALSLAGEVSRNRSVSWDKSGAALSLATMQRPDGSFLDNTHATGEAIIAASTMLNSHGILNLESGWCISRDFRRQLAEATAANSTSTLNSTTKAPLLLPSVPSVLLEGEAKDGGESNAIQKRTQQGTTPVPVPIPGHNPISVPVTAMANIKYWLWIGPDALGATKHNISLTVPVNTTFFEVMKRAVEEDSSYEFSATVWPNGHYVHTLSGHREQPLGYNYWLLYKLADDPDPRNPPSTSFVAPAGVDSLLVQDGDVYFFWYKKL